MYIYIIFYISDEVITAVIITASVAIFLFTSIVAVYLGYRHRHRLISAIYRTKNFFSCGCVGDDVRYTFDVFLSYCSEDRRWVCEKLLPVLEEKHGITCCVHERDFPASGDLFDVIQSYMQTSRVLIMMLSADSVQKEWPKYELRIANHLNLMKNRCVIYIKLGDLGRNLPGLVQRVTASKIYREWPQGGNEEKESEFWNKIVASIHGDSVCCQCCRSWPSVPIRHRNEIEIPLVSQV